MTCPNCPRPASPESPADISDLEFVRVQESVPPKDWPRRPADVIETEDINDAKPLSDPRFPDPFRQPEPGLWERLIKKLKERRSQRPQHEYRGQDLLSRTPANPEPYGRAGTPVVVEDVPD